MSPLRLVVPFAIVAFNFVQSDIGNEFNNLLRTLANEGLSMTQIQHYIDHNVKHTDRSIGGRGLIKEVSRELGDTFRKTFDVLNDLKSHYEGVYDELKTEPVYYDCCKQPKHVQFTYDDQFKAYINADSLCYVGVGSKKPNKLPKHFSQDIISVMKRNYENHKITKWQYIGSEDGVMHIYPASNSCLVNSDTFDPRFRPWYVEAATPEPKDIIIVIDRSRSMSEVVNGRTLMHTAREAAKTVIDTLNPNDRVGILTFSDHPEIPTATGVPDCYSKVIAQGTPENKENLKRLIDRIMVISGGSHYIPALNKSFDLLSESHQTKRDSVILFLSDGKPSEDEESILQTINDRNSKLGNSVIILTFGIGSLEVNQVNILENIAKQKGANDTYGRIRVGKFTFVPKPADLRQTMGTYYEIFTKSANDSDNIISVPYFDGFGLGVITSLCSAVAGKSLYGVACVDLVLSDLLEVATYFRPSEDTYAFIMDNHGRMMTHPLLPKLYSYSDRPLFVDVTEIETSTEVKEIVESMRRGESGTKSVFSSRIISRGDSIHDGVDSVPVQSEYFWERITHSNHSVCIVVGSNDKQIEYTSYKALKQFHYHRIDLTKPNGLCNMYKQLASKDHTCVKFTADAFVKPVVYLHKKEDIAAIKEYKKLMEDESLPVDHRFGSGVRELVAVTSQVDTFWLDPNTIKNTKNYTIWKYISTRNGVFRIYPCSPLYRQYDHTTRPWYRKAMSNKGRYALTTPYTDAAGAGTIMTLAKTIYEGKNGTHDTSDAVLGVMGLDFSISQFYSLIVETFPECGNNKTVCFVVDSSGYLVIHRDFVENVDESTRVEHIHIIEKEPEISYDLQLKGHMTKHACVDLSDIQDQFFWRIEIAKDNEIVTTTNLHYKLYNIRESNSFFVMKTFVKPDAKHKCHCHTKRGGDIVLCRLDRNSCECPCSKHTKYDYCGNEFISEGDQWPVCVPDSPPITTTETLGNNLALKQPKCYDYRCKLINSKRECQNVVGCSWCRRDSLRRPILKPYCDVRTECPVGTESKKSIDGGWGPWGPWEVISTCSNPCGEGLLTRTKTRLCNSPVQVYRGRDCTGPTTMTNSSEPCTGECLRWEPIVGGVVGGVIALAVIVGVSVHMYKKRKSRPTSQPMFHANYPGSQETNSSTEQSSGSSNMLMPLPRFVQPRNPIYESGDGEVETPRQSGHADDMTDSNFTLATPPPSWPPPQIPRIHHGVRPDVTQGMYINPNDRAGT